MEIGRPLLIDDDDCDVGEPTPVDDDSIRPNGIFPPAPGQAAPHTLAALIPVVRMTAQLRKSMKSRTIAASTLATYDEHFRTVMATFPEPFPINSQAHLDPRLLTAACALQTNRFILYRHNLSPACKAADRHDALERCVSVAKDTAHYVSRSMRSPSDPPSQGGYHSTSHMTAWGQRLRTMAPAFFCAHLWRCTLVLCFTGEYAAALTLVQASAAIGELRKNNISCGRNLAFFLDRLTERLRNGVSLQALETDEEMLAYVSGDLQGAPDGAWAWAGSETGSSTMQQLPMTNGSPPEAATVVADATQLTERELQSWGGWEHVQRVLTQLLHDRQERDQQQQRAQRQQQQQATAAAAVASQPTPPHQQQAPPSAPRTQTTPTYPPPPSPYGFVQSPISPQQQQQQQQSTHHFHNQQPSRSPQIATPGMQPLPPPPAPFSPNPSLGGNGNGGTSNRISIKDIM